jgi:hypothetical protein
MFKLHFHIDVYIDTTDDATQAADKFEALAAALRKIYPVPVSGISVTPEPPVPLH